MLNLLIRLSGLILGCCYVAVATTEDLQQSQLSSLTERMNRMISSLYSPSSKLQSSSTLPTLTDTPSTPTNNSPTYSYPASSPQLFYFAPPPPIFPPSGPFYPEPGVQQVDYGYSGNPFHRSVFAAPYNYDLGYHPVYPPYPYPPPYPFPPVAKPNDFYPYPEYPQPQHRPIPQPLSPPPFNSPYPFYPPPYHPVPPSYPANFAPYPPNPYAKPHELSTSPYP